MDDNIYKNVCIEPNCNVCPSFNFINKYPNYCTLHKKDGMINVKSKKCKEKNCNTSNPSFNYKNIKFGIYCSKHKKENMIDVINKRCLFENCDKRPSYNYENEKIKIYCLEHKKNGMINISSKKCLKENCNKIPIYNLVNQNSAIYCLEHKEENMINVVHKRCLEENCNKRPSFNLLNIKTPIYCSQHKKEYMIDVVNKRCLQENCNFLNPSFNFENEKTGLYCSNHKKENMINVVSKTCLELNCNIQPRFNFENEKIGLYCSIHKKDNMFDVISKRCKECNDKQVGNKYKGYCLRCFVYKFPDVKISRNYKVKENHMTDFIKDQFKDEVMIFDKQTGGCSKRRPDVCIDKFTHVVIVECDEYQHKNEEYNSCENMRTMELFQDFANRPIVFIRFNPDCYVNDDSKKVLSSFKMHKALDVPVIRDSKEWTSRLNVLKETIHKWITEIPSKELTYEYLFYDK
jgi:hypothetical protein